MHSGASRPEREPMARKVGPIEIRQLPNGQRVPFYVIRYDENGECESPRTRDHLFEELRKGDYTEVFVFSHGWNNTPKEAVNAYQEWINGFSAFRANGGHQFTEPYHPLLVGIIWPSVWFVAPWDRGPKLAAAGEVDEAFDEDIAAIHELAKRVDDDLRARYYELVEAETLEIAEARELLDLLAGVVEQGDQDIGEEQPGDLDELFAAWPMSSDDAGAFVPEEEGAVTVGADASDEAQAAGAVGRAPVDLIRMLSVWPMKDRAGVVGTRGVSHLITGILTATGGATRGARVHLAGHSFGSKVLMSAVAAPDELPREVDSMLLLQPAVNHLCFAERVPGKTWPGGYHGVLGRITLPILSTFTNQDFALRSAFHLALVRNGDLGEIRFASGDEPPSRFAALGGYGPREAASSQIIDAHAPGSAYPLAPGQPEVYGVRSHTVIGGHGEVRNDSTHWMLFSLVKAAQELGDG